ncbi:MAG: flagellar FlbD family protein [Acidimicrobiales bacterium]|jgi:flagellar protein FlbD|nr:flagellar FlbD family protein [Acidimicrobiales bacterium]
MQSGTTQQETRMIWATRINGTEVVINADLIETIEPTPDTVVTLVDGKKFILAESAQEVIRRVLQFRAALLRASTDMALDGPYGVESASPEPARTAAVVRLAPTEEL